MKMSKVEFGKKHNIGPQWLSVLCSLGVVPLVGKEPTRKRKDLEGKKKREWVEDESILLLKKEVHYVECPVCLKKMGCITRNHCKVCSVNINGIENLYCTVSLEKRIPTEEELNRRSEALLEVHRSPNGEAIRKKMSESHIKMYTTSQGEAAKKAISEAVKLRCLDPEYIEARRISSTLYHNIPEIREKTRVDTLKRWEDPEYRKQRMDYIGNNKAYYADSAQNARKYLKKESSGLHIRYKETLVNNGIEGFISEYLCDYYRLDEADPLAKIAVEVDGCYWHGCEDCGLSGYKKAIATDHRKTSYLQNRGWIIIRVKECEIKKDPNTAIEMIKELQVKRRGEAKIAIRESFLNGTLRVKSMVNKEEKPQWVPVSDVLRHHTPHKRMIEVITESGSSIKVTEDHSLFEGATKEPIKTSDIKPGDSIVGLVDREFKPITVKEVNDLPSEEFTYDLSVPGSENFVVDSGILAHNSYSISGVSLDIDKSSKYQSMKENFIQEYDKVVDAAKRSIKIIKGLKQPRFGIGISSALGPFSGNGVQSRANWVRGGGFS